MTVKNGTADKAAYAEGETVKVKADKAPAGKVFDKWVVVKGDNVKFDDATKAEASFSMPANEVAVAATFKDDKKPDNNDHNATNNGADKNKGKDNSAKKTAAPSTGDNGAVPFAAAFGIMLVSLAALRKLSMKKS